MKAGEDALASDPAIQSKATLKKTASEIACVISGMTTGRKSKPSIRLLPGKRPRAIARAIIVPSAVAMMVAIVPTKRLLRKALSMISVEKARSAPMTLFKMLLYHFSVKPVNEATDLLSLKEKQHQNQNRRPEEEISDERVQPEPDLAEAADGAVASTSPLH